MLDKIYAKCPVAIQNLAISAYGYRWQQRRFGGIFEKELEAFKARESFGEQDFADYQTTMLRRLLVHAFETVPYYQRLFKLHGYGATQLRDFELHDLAALPFLEKNDLRTQGTGELISKKREAGGEFYSSSGSTGTPVRILFSNAMHQRWSAGFEARIRHWAGVTRRMPRGMIGGRRVVPEGNGKAPFYRYNFAEKQTYFSAYHISAANTPDYLEGMRRHRVSYMTGYAMSNFFLARFIEESGLEAPPLKAVLPSSEKLSPEMRDTFLRVYHCKSYDAWSGVEACGLVSECEHGNLHASPDIGILEFLEPETGAPAKPGRPAEVVCTGLLNFDQPLIRYRIGDLMLLSDEKCPCGRCMPVIREITGRTEDTVVGIDGRKLLRFHGIFIDLPKIVEGQVIQYSLSDFEVRVVVSQPLAEQEKQCIRRRMRSQLGEVNVAIQEVAGIQRGANGKFQAVISHIFPTP